MTARQVRLPQSLRIPAAWPSELRAQGCPPAALQKYVVSRRLRGALRPAALWRPWLRSRIGLRRRRSQPHSAELVLSVAFREPIPTPEAALALLSIVPLSRRLSDGRSRRDFRRECRIRRCRRRLRLRIGARWLHHRLPGRRAAVPYIRFPASNPRKTMRAQRLLLELRPRGTTDVGPCVYCIDLLEHCNGNILSAYSPVEHNSTDESIRLIYLMPATLGETLV